MKFFVIIIVPLAGSLSRQLDFTKPLGVFFMRKTVILTEMFKDVATPSEMKKFELLYAKNNKGSATVFALRVIKVYWNVFIAHKDKAPSLPDHDKGERTIKINHAGVSWHEKL